MLFKYKGFDKSGTGAKGTIEAESLQSAKALLRSKNIIYTKISQENQNIFEKFKISRQVNMKTATLSVISRDLSIYLQAGIPLINAVKLIHERYIEDKKLNSFFILLLAYLDEGKNFYTALSIQNIYKLPEFYLQAIKISENGGMLDKVLKELSNYLDNQMKINKQITSSLAYPLFIIMVSFIMVGFMLSFIVPKITSIFEQNSQELPEITKVVITLGDFFSHNILIITLVFIGAILVFSYFFKNSESFKYFVDKCLLKLPFLGKFIQINELSRFSYINSILITSGVPVVQSFQLGSDILKNSVIKKLFTDANEKIVEGEKLSKVLDTNTTFKLDRSFVKAIAIGEETSELNTILQSLVELYNVQNQDKIKIFLTLLEPFAMLIVGSIIGVIVIAMLLPIFSMNIG